MFVDHSLIASPFDGYRLIDSGHAYKLEEIGGWLVQRPCVQALWRPRLDADLWQAAGSRCLRDRDGGGHWEHQQRDPGSLSAEWKGPIAACRFRLALTAFGHCGLFAEQAPVWEWLQQWIARQATPPRIANLFAYTGCGSIAMAAAGAEVFHVDSAKGILSWCRDNLQANPHIPGQLRCIHDDARSFLRFSCKRGFRYHGLVMDPPAWGHGKKKETWTIEQDLMELLELAVAVLEPGGFLHLSCHSPGIQSAALANCLASLGDWQDIQQGSLLIAHNPNNGSIDTRLLPCGIYACASDWSGRQRCSSA